MAWDQTEGLVVLAVGPEGGFTDHERQVADQTWGWLAISLQRPYCYPNRDRRPGWLRGVLLTHVKELDP